VIANYCLLALSLFFLRSSLTADLILPDNDIEILTFIEEGLKFIGILFWLMYFFKTAVIALQPAQT
jgi:hypothetical protein